MPKLLIPKIAQQLFHGQWGEVCIDSRAVKKGDVFVALPGNNCHGNDFISEVIEKGAVCIIADANAPYPKHPLVMADKNPEEFLWQLSIAVLELSKARRIAVTGSNGKTTTKDMLACILGTEKEVHRTRGNYNNHLGVPITLCQLKDHHSIVVIELGTSNPGEIERLTNLVQPEFSVLTSINRAHLSGFKSLSAIALEKSSIFRYAQQAQCFLRSIDWNHRSVRQSLGQRNPVFFDIDQPEGEIQELDTQTGCLRWKFHGEEFTVASPAPHNKDNAQAALCVGLAMGISLAEMKQRLAQWKSPDHRMCMLNWKKRKIIDDCYNANPASVVAALETAVGLRRNDQQRIVVLFGDMKEMGRQSKSLHRNVGVEMARLGVDMLFTLGEFAKESLYSFERSGGSNFGTCKNTDEMAQMVKHYSRPNDIILVKGSRSMHLEQVFDSLNESSTRRRQLTC